MATRKTPKKKTTAVSVADVTSSDFRVLRAFHHPPAADSTFGFGRFYWPEGAGHRQSILSNIRKKRRPVAGDEDQDTAARVEVLLPSDALEEYTDIEFLVRRFEEKLPQEEATAYAQVTLRFPDAPNLHHPYEVARSWARSFFVESPLKTAPVVLVLHAPHFAGSDSPTHIHALVLPRKLSRFGWGASVSELASDSGRDEALASWVSFRAERYLVAKI